MACVATAAVRTAAAAHHRHVHILSLLERTRHQSGAPEHLIVGMRSQHHDASLAFKASGLSRFAIQA
jgi:hypothetical protein